jgi:hypothetical protein
MIADNTGRSRRDFFYLAGALTVGTASGQNRVKTVEPKSPRIGILLATTFTTGTAAYWIVLCCAKDLDHHGKAGHKPAGYGVLDYDRYMSVTQV